MSVTKSTKRLVSVTTKDKKRSNYSQIGAGMNKTACELPTVDLEVDEDTEDREDEMDNMRIYMRNHSTSYVVRWNFYKAIGLFLAVTMETWIYLLAHFSANYVFPGATGAVERAKIIAATAFFVKISFGLWTSAYLDPIRSICGIVTFVLTRGSKISRGSTWMELLKVIFIVAQFLGALLAVSVLGAWTDTAIKTDDCSIPLVTPAVCDVYPRADVGVTVASLNWMEALGAFFIYGSFVFGERILAWHYPGILWSGLLYGGSHFMVHALFSTAAGGSFNFWYWAMSKWFSNVDDPNQASRVWPLIVGCIVVSVVEIIGVYVYNRFRGPSKNAYSEESKMM